MNKLATLELIDFILQSISLIRGRFENINSSDDFLVNDENLTKMEAILMRLQASGEAIKNLQKRDNDFLLNVAAKNYWDEIIRFRDLLSHHYTDIQADIIFEICSEEIDELEQKMKQLRELI
jgi:uncharacterized protein with HEPN domain